jgi:hypothetical protein
LNRFERACSVFWLLTPDVGVYTHVSLFALDRYHWHAPGGDRIVGEDPMVWQDPINDGVLHAVTHGEGRREETRRREETEGRDGGKRREGELY